MLIGVHGVEAFETFGSGDGAELGDVGRAVGSKFHAGGVGAAYADQGCGEEIGTMGDGASDENASGAGAFAGEALRAGVFVGDEISCAGDEVVDGVLLGEFVAGALPLFSVFTAAANVRDCDYPAALEPRQPDWIEVGVIGNSISAVADQVRGVISIKLGAFRTDDRERNHGAVVALGLDFNRFVGRGVDGQRCLNAGVRGGFGFEIVLQPARGGGPGDSVDQGSRFGRRNCERTCGLAFTGRDGLDMAVEGKAADAADTSVQIAHVDCVAGYVGFLDYDFTGRDYDCGVSYVGIFEAGAGYFIARFVFVSDEIKVVFVDVVADDCVIHIDQFLPHDWGCVELIEGDVVDGGFVLGSVSDDAEEIG